MSVLVAHPGLQHSHQLAWALHERGLLHAFWSGIPVVGDGESLPLWMPTAFADKVKRVGIPARLRRHPLFFQAVLRIGSRLPIAYEHKDFTHRVFHAFDWWVARQIPKFKPKVVVGYENSSFYTFRAAKAIGAKCILDAPSLHHAAVERLIPVTETPYLSEINRRKDDEVASADLLLTCSPLAAESYVAAGVFPGKVRPMLLGATSPQNLPNRLPHKQPLRFIFAGSLRYLKSIDLMLAVFKRLGSEGKTFELVFVGGEGEPGWIRNINQTPGARHIPGLPQQELFQLLAQSDCLLLPSRFDSFGMVVAEAMACGTPAIVSSHTGAKAMIENFPGSGWIVAGNEESLYRCVKDRLEAPDSLFSARAKAKEAASQYTWAAYRERVGSLIEKWLADE